MRKPRTAKLVWGVLDITVLPWPFFALAMVGGTVAVSRTFAVIGLALAGLGVALVVSYNRQSRAYFREQRRLAQEKQTLDAPGKASVAGSQPAAQPKPAPPSMQVTAPHSAAIRCQRFG